MNKTALNKKANREMKAYCMDHGISSCELRLEGCMNGLFLTFAHRHKRRWYYDKPDSLLWRRGQWLLACQSCHEAIEHNKELTERIFDEHYT